MERKKIFWGVLFLAGAVMLLADKLGFIEGVGFWSIFWTAVLVTILVKSIIKRKFGRILFAAAFLIIVNDKALHLEAITPWPVLWAALFGTIGLKLLFPRLGGNGDGHILRIGNGGGAVNGYAGEGDMASYSNVFGDSVKYILGDVGRVKVVNVFGATQIYFTEALLRNGFAEVEVENVFGSVELFVPSSWRVVLNTENVFAGADEKGRCCPDESNVLRIGGTIAFGGLDVVYV